MTHNNAAGQYWNIFAQELQRILKIYGIALPDLIDRVGIAEGKVLRLIQSLYIQGSLPVLNSTEMQLMVDMLSIEQDDVLHLQAAMLATQLQRQLSEQMDPAHARLAAEQTLQAILDGLKVQVGKEEQGELRGGDITSLEDDKIDKIFASIINAFDQGEEMLRQSHDATLYMRQVKRAQQARACFEAALADLHDQERKIQLLPDWRNWYNQVQKGLADTSKRLNDLSG